MNIAYLHRGKIKEKPVIESLLDHIYLRDIRKSFVTQRIALSQLGIDELQFVSTLKSRVTTAIDMKPAGRIYRDYKPAKGYKGKTGQVDEPWNIYYSYMDYNTGRFKRYNIVDNLNRIKSLKEKEAHYNDLINDLNKQLKAGYNPMLVENLAQEVINEEIEARFQKDNVKYPSLLSAFKDFLSIKSAKDLSVSTLQAYQGYIGKFENYMFVNKVADIKVNNLDTKFIKDMLTWLQDLHKWNGTTYNNHLNFWVTLLNWFAKNPRKWVVRDSFYIGNDEQLEQKVTKPMKNQYFGDTVAEKVKEKMEAFPKLLFMSKFIYFSCMRPDEIRNLKIENVDITGRYIKIIGKTKSRTVPICDELAEMLESLELERFPASHYVIGYQGNVSKNRHSENYFTQTFRDHVRKPLGISENFTMYSWKHSRCVHLLGAGYSDAEVMNLTGHRDTASYDKYKRDLINHLQTRLRGKTIDW